MPGSGGRASLGQLLAGGRRVTQGCGGMWGILLAEGWLLAGFCFGLVWVFFFFLSLQTLKFKSHLTLKEQNMAIAKPDKCNQRDNYSLLVLLTTDAKILSKILTHSTLSRASKE